MTLIGGSKAMNDGYHTLSIGILISAFVVMIFMVFTSISVMKNEKEIKRPTKVFMLHYRDKPFKRETTSIPK